MHANVALALASLAIVAFVGASAGSAPQTGQAGSPVLTPAPSGCDDFWRHEPLVVYDVSGSSFAGPLSIHLAAYNDGSVVFTRFYLFEPERQAEAVFLAPEVTRQLFADLRAASAFELCDQPSFATDTPLSTLTVFRGTTEARAHTISWWAAHGAYAELELILHAFIDEHFPLK
jgi:hypothetical protein